MRSVQLFFQSPPASRPDCAAHLGFSSRFHWTRELDSRTQRPSTMAAMASRARTMVRTEPRLAESQGLAFITSLPYNLNSRLVKCRHCCGSIQLGIYSCAPSPGASGPRTPWWIQARSWRRFFVASRVAPDANIPMKLPVKNTADRLRLGGGPYAATRCSSRVRRGGSRRVALDSGFPGGNSAVGHRGPTLLRIKRLPNYTGYFCEAVRPTWESHVDCVACLLYPSGLADISPLLWSARHFPVCSPWDQYTAPGRGTSHTYQTYIMPGTVTVMPSPILSSSVVSFG